MKKTLIAFASAIVMMAASACQNQKNETVACASEGECAGLGIAYVNTDSLLFHYDYAVKLSDELASKSEASRADFNQKARVFQQDAAEFQRKVQNNGFISQDRYEKEGLRLQKAQQDLQELEARLSNDLAKEQARMSQELNDTLTKVLNEFADGRYKIILNTNMLNNAVLYSAPGVDVTDQVVDILNKRFAAKK
ncbi:MAG: OmpH family outer membrane protein [Bacteroidales bacterium]|nr:OmpH family outer membrane protein [Bacteroidales bacterium]